MPGYKNGLLFTTTSMLTQYQQGVVAYLGGGESRSAWRKPTASLYRTEKKRVDITKHKYTSAET